MVLQSKTALLAVMVSLGVLACAGAANAMDDPHNCPPGTSWKKHGLGASCVSSAPPAPAKVEASCSALVAADKARLNHFGELSVARGQLATAEHRLANAGPAGHYDAAAAVARWNHAVDQAKDKMDDAAHQEDLIAAAMRKAGLDPSKCPGLAHLRPR